MSETPNASEPEQTPPAAQAPVPSATTPAHPSSAGTTSQPATPGAQPPQATQPAPPAPPHTGAAFQAKAKPSSRKRTVTASLVAALAVGALIGGASGAGVTLWATSNAASAPIIGNANPAAVTVNNTDDVTRITAVAAKASPSVVTINVSSSNSGGTGSGIVLNKDGYIVTNTHVVTLDGASADGKIVVTTSDGRLLPATVVGTDPISDLAVIKVDANSDLPPAEFADSTKLNVGDTAIAIGAPLGLSGTVTNGIVSALNRSITIASSAVPEDTDTQGQTPDTRDPYNLFNFDLPGKAPTSASSPTIALSVIQTDAAINPGNSGGALLNGQGEVIGVNVAIASAGGNGGGGQAGSIGVGFAIPANLVQRVAKEIIADGSATHGLLGASVGDVLGNDSSGTQPQVIGATVVKLTPGGAADSAGLKDGDVITKFNGIPITGKTDLTAQVRAVAAGSSATVTYVRDGKAAQVDVTLGALQ